MRCLGDQVVDHVAVEIGEPVIAAAVVVGELGVVDAELIENRGVNVVDVHGILDRLPAEVVGGAVGEAAA